MNKRPWMPWYVSDWYASLDVQMMTPEAESCYRVLLDKAWMSDDGGLPADDQTLIRILGKFGPWWEASAAIVRKKFELRGDKLYNPRLCAELDKVKEISTKRQQAASKRHAIASANGHANADTLHTHTSHSHFTLTF